MSKYLAAMSDSNSPTDNLNNFVAGLALLSAFLSAILYYRACLPSVKFKELDELLNETKSIYSQAEAEGLLPTNPQDLTRLKTLLKNLEESRAELREETYRETTPFSECMAVLRGLSRNIVKKTDDAKKLRASIVTTSEEQRRRRRGDYQPPTMALSSEDLDASITQSPDFGSHHHINRRCS
ncbi:hypothetical protein BDQ12DRAFT_107265 [Crucibulum laeve]|uniref:Uncharacterized protein n=1 Tax=Crucibulum laeve TaxID=68775 RepID=A0A5C3LS71_9AGAR|nr:hypothetical protein BDQ12DRAFT_107265 [Crucibulum laeve]